MGPWKWVECSLGWMKFLLLLGGETEGHLQPTEKGETMVVVWFDGAEVEMVVVAAAAVIVVAGTAVLVVATGVVATVATVAAAVEPARIVGAAVAELVVGDKFLGIQIGLVV